MDGCSRVCDLTISVGCGINTHKKCAQDMPVFCSGIQTPVSRQESSSSCEKPLPRSLSLDLPSPPLTPMLRSPSLSDEAGQFNEGPESKHTRTRSTSRLLDFRNGSSQRPDRYAAPSPSNSIDSVQKSRNGHKDLSVNGNIFSNLLKSTAVHSKKLQKERDAANLPLNLFTTTPKNMSRFVARVAYASDMQDFVFDLLAWKDPSQSGFFLLGYIFLCTTSYCRQ